MGSAGVPFGLLAAGIGVGYVLVIRRLTGRMLASRTAAAVAIFPVLRVSVAGLVVAIGCGVGRWAIATMLIGLAAGWIATLAVVLAGKAHDR